MSEKDRQFASEISHALTKQQGLLKKAAVEETKYQAKIAALQSELQIHRDVIGLVTSGMIDPNDAAEKLAMMLEDPDQIEVFKAALALGVDKLPSIGASVSEEFPTSDDDNPIAKVLRENESRLRSI